MTDSLYVLSAVQYHNMYKILACDFQYSMYRPIQYPVNISVCNFRRSVSCTLHISVCYQKIRKEVPPSQISETSGRLQRAAQQETAGNSVKGKALC